MNKYGKVIHHYKGYFLLVINSRVAAVLLIVESFSKEQ
jgi:hypothetical protein